jgi:hypothetical protein
MIALLSVTAPAAPPVGTMGILCFAFAGLVLGAVAGYCCGFEHGAKLERNRIEAEQAARAKRTRRRFDDYYPPRRVQPSPIWYSAESARSDSDAADRLIKYTRGQP